MAEYSRASEDRVEGKNAVMEALKAGRPLDKIYIARGEQDKALRFIAQKGKAAGAVISEVDRRKLDAMSVTHAHQGVIAVAAVREYSTVADILAIAAERGEAPLIVVCDEISDPQNLGAIIRTAECAGAHGVVIPKHRSAGVTAIVEKTSAGAVEHMAVARVVNLAAALKELQEAGVWVFGTAADGEKSLWEADLKSPAALKELQEAGVWIFGTAADGEKSLWEADLKSPAALVIGSEGSGMSRLTRENCDFLLSIPLRGQVSSLNASNAAAVVLYEAVRQRLG